VPILFALSDRQLWQLARLLLPGAYRKGEAVFRTGDEADTFYIVQSGAFTCFTSEGAHAHVCVCVCVCVCVRARVCVRVCVCVRSRTASWQCCCPHVAGEVGGLFTSAEPLLIGCAGPPD
jgi:hypothetical protein